MEELVVGVKKANLAELRELKVKLPVRLLVTLHYVKLTRSRAISDVVNEALTEYFDQRSIGKAPPPEAEQERVVESRPSVESTAEPPPPLWAPHRTTITAEQ